MTIIEAREILREFNEWRRGGDSVMLDPADIGIAIDFVVEYLKDDCQ